MARKVRITVTCIWNVNDNDYDDADDLIANPDIDAAIDAIYDGRLGDNSMTDIKATYEEVKE